MGRTDRTRNKKGKKGGRGAYFWELFRRIANVDLSGLRVNNFTSRGKEGQRDVSRRVGFVTGDLKGL